MTVNDRSQDIANIRAIAEAELKHELLREAVEKMKVELRQRKWFHRIFPWKIVIIRRTVC
jgi:hypothetical protein